MRLPRLVPALLLATIICASCPPATAASKSQGQNTPRSSTRPSTQPEILGYIGISVTDIPDGHTIFSWFFPGPIDGQGLEAGNDFDLQRPDLLVSVDGQKMNSEQFKAYIGSRLPGSQLTLEYRRSKARGATIPDAVNHEDEVRKLTITVEPAVDWRGTDGRPRRSSLEVSFVAEALLDPDNPQNALGAAIAEHKLAEPLSKLREAFVKFRDRSTDLHQLARVRAGFTHPFRLPELQRLITDPAQSAPGDPFATAARMIRENLDAGAPSRTAIRPISREAGTPQETAMISALNGAAQHLRQALPRVPDEKEFAKQAAELLRVPRRTFYVAGPDTKQLLAVMRMSETINVEHFAGAVEALAPIGAIAPAGLEALEARDPPPSVKDAVEGKVISAAKGPDGWIVIGGAEPNRYDMSKLAGVIDIDGDDEYWASDWCFGVRAIVDFAGNDRYSGTDDQGPGSAILGVTLIDDRGGDDSYEGKLLCAGAAMFGVSLLIDRNGNDTYTGSEWSAGAAMYGAGFLIDLGGGSDIYIGEFLCQGAGGPLGLGAIIDAGGNDLYRVNGPQPSSYGVPAVYSAFSQGVGFGYRNYAHGGVGLISDLGGDDRYEAGEFAQGGAYYYALGILHDASGRDLYYGNRYTQGFGVHQGFGILADDAGNDVYWSQVAANQGGAWDVGAGLLIDRGGDDTYRADGLAQGGASMQGIAMLIDLDGRDRYDAGGGATQGQSGGNDYHFHTTGAFSFSLLLDLGGKQDLYSRERPSNGSVTTGAANEASPKSSELHGLAIDR